jgi:ABC-2 type transport system permease protein
MNFMAFAARNRKEITRDPLSMVFGIGFPVVLILMISFMKQSIKDMPSALFSIESFAPGMAVFGLSFISLFLGMLIATDRNSSFLMRLFSSPLTGFDYIVGYALPLFPVALFQSVVCFATALIFGLTLSVNILLALIVLLPVAALFISLGLLMGSLFSSHQVGGFSSILVNVSAWLSGTWFSLDMIGGAFRTVCYALPFAHAVDSVTAAVTGDYSVILPHVLWVLGYTVIICTAAVMIFRKKMKNA